MKINDLMNELGIRESYQSQWDLLESWADIVNDCKTGYNQNVYELDYDLITRNEIELLKMNDIFRKDKEYEIFCKKINDLDLSFLKLIKFENSEDRDLPFWKRKFIVKNAGDEYKSSF